MDLFDTLTFAKILGWTTFLDTLSLTILHLVFDVEPAYAYAHYTCKDIGALKFVTREVLDEAAMAVERQLTSKLCF
jgi:hypothetical protein